MSSGRTIMSSINRSQLLEAYIAEKTIERTRRYLAEGRHSADLTDEELTDAWVGTFRDLAGTNFSRDLQWAGILDIESELRLRRIETPVDRVQPELALLTRWIERQQCEGSPHPVDCPEVRAELADLRQRLSRPKH